MKTVKFAMGILMAVLACGCESGYQPLTDAYTGGYGEEQQAYNAYIVYFAGNAFTPEQRSEDFSLLRSAELTLANGFSYFVPLGSKTESPVSYGGVRPASFRIIVCYRKEPTHIGDELKSYNAKQTFDQIVTRYKLEKDGKPLSPKTGTFKPDPNAIKFKMRPGFELEAIAGEDVDYVIRSSKTFDMDGTIVGRFVDIENPTESIEDFIAAAVPIAAEKGANGVVVENDPAEIQRNQVLFGDMQVEIAGFVADLYVIPTACLGIEWEPADLAMGKHIVRRFKPNSQAPQAGLKLGDKILEINGIDVLNRSEYVKEARKWSVGETAKLAVVRAGEEQTFEVTLVPNI